MPEVGVFHAQLGVHHDVERRVGGGGGVVEAAERGGAHAELGGSGFHDGEGEEEYDSGLEDGEEEDVE